MQILEAAPPEINICTHSCFSAIHNKKVNLFDLHPVRYQKHQLNEITKLENIHPNKTTATKLVNTN
jgi:hypothetical protein